MKKETFSQLVSDGEAIAESAQAEFGNLDADQLNWKPAPNQWSIGQCFHHLITTNLQYFSIFDDVINNAYRASLWQRINPFSTWLGTYLVKNLGPQVKQKFKTPTIFKPAYSEISADIIPQFVEHQGLVLEYFESMEDFPVDKIIISSPASAMITYSLEHAMKIVVEHEKRHLGQALRVRNLETFPID